MIDDLSQKDIEKILSRMFTGLVAGLSAHAKLSNALRETKNFFGVSCLPASKQKELMKALADSGKTMHVSLAELGVAMGDDMQSAIMESLFECCGKEEIIKYCKSETGHGPEMN